MLLKTNKQDLCGACERRKRTREGLVSPCGEEDAHVGLKFQLKEALRDSVSPTGSQDSAGDTELGDWAPKVFPRRKEAKRNGASSLKIFTYQCIKGCAGLFERPGHEGGANFLEQIYLKRKLLVSNFLATLSSFLIDAVAMAGNLLTAWVQCDPAIRRHDSMHPIMSLGIATMKGRKVRVGEDTMSPGAARPWKDLRAHLKK